MMTLSTWEFRLLLIAALAASLIISAIRISRIAGRIGRSPWAWFFISLFFTAIPAAVVFWHDRAKSLSAGYARKNDESDAHPHADRSRPTGLCPHCGAILDAEDRTKGECPHCRMAIDEGHYA